MSDFFIGMLVGVVVLDLLWAWKIGLVDKVIQSVKMKWKLIKARTL